MPGAGLQGADHSCVWGRVDAALADTQKGKDAHDALEVQLDHHGVGETGPKVKAQELQRLSIPEDGSEVQWVFLIDKWEDNRGFYKLTTKGKFTLTNIYAIADAAVTLQYKLYAATGGPAKTMDEG